MDFTKEQIEKVAQFSGVTREEAWVALEQAGGSPLDAVILLERHGRSAAVPGGSWSTRSGPPPEEPNLCVKPAAAPCKKPAHRKYTAKEVGDTVKNFLRNCTKITVDIWRGEDLLAGIPLVVCVLLFVVAFRLMLALAVVGLVLRCRYHISGWEGNAADINRTMDQVTDTVAGWTDRARSRWKDYYQGKSVGK